MRRRLTTLILLLCSFSGIYAQQVVTNLFQPKGTLSRNFHSIARKYQSLEINSQQLSTLKQQAPSTLELQLPFEGNELTLELEKVSITSDNFSVIEALPNNETRIVSYSGSVFYHGKIKGSQHSFAAISFVGNEVIGIASDDQSNIVLGSIQEDGRSTSEYALYRDNDLNVSGPTNCFAIDDNPSGPITLGTAGSSPTGRETFVGEAVDIYFEADLALYQSKGNSTIDVINYILGFFNNTALLYANENIKIQVSQIKVWTTIDPEAQAGLNSTSSCLTSFANRMANADYIGDFAHFLSRRNLGGGIAYVNDPCPNKFNRSAVSAIDNSYSNFPTYSWTVQVVTHELGHNLGSRHTHWCGWPGGPIDGCGPTANSGYQEGTCAIGPIPINKGTIMSYCHLLGTGISFNNGFGPLPGQRIRDFVAGMNACNTCTMTIDLAKQDASCGQPNGQVVVTVNNAPSGTVTYLWSNGQTTNTLSGVGPGTYHVTVKSGNCQVMEDVEITNGGNLLTFDLTPNGTAGFCAGGNLTLQATNNVAYSYVWRNGTTVIPGATTSSLNVTAAGNYSVTATSGACSGTQNVAVSVIAAPTATITPSGPTTFCSGSSVTLNASIGAAYQYQWFDGATAITGATTGSLVVNTSGSYSVRVRAGNTCEATSTATTVTVNPSPTANVAVSGPTQFCAGSGALLTTTSDVGYTYQWYDGANPIGGATNASYLATAAGSYTVRTTLGPCTVTSAPPVVTSVLPSPAVTVTPATSTINKFETQTLTGSGAATYNWSSLLDMVSSTTTTGTYRPLVTRTYEVEGTAANGCKDTAYATINVIGCGEVTEVEKVVLSPSRVRLSWVQPQEVTSDSIRYRKVGTTTWTYIFVEESPDSEREIEINNLEANTEYEFEVIPLCSTTTVFVASPTQAFRTAELENGLYILLSPNPTVSSLQPTLEIISSNAYSLDIDIFDYSGKLVKKVSVAENMPAGQTLKRLDISKLASGLYIINVNVNKKKHPIKMIVSH